VYYFLDGTPTHSYMKALYRYPQRAYPYAELVAENRRRGRDAPEYELIDTGVFADNRFWDLTVEYAKAEAEDLLIRLTVANHGPQAETLHLLPQIWFRNTWSWGYDDRRPSLQAVAGCPDGTRLVQAQQHQLGSYWLACEGAPELLFTENESNAERLWGAPNGTPFVKDGINAAIVEERTGAVNPAQTGTKAAAHYVLELAPGAEAVVRLRLAARQHTAPFAEYDDLIARRIAEADEFYASLGERVMDADARLVQRQALAGLLWSKQFYYIDVAQWLDGDPGQPPPPAGRRQGRNAAWRELNNEDILSMPDTWEYPWFAAWDLAFHTLPLALVDPQFAKHQLILLLREWYMHANGQLPAYEWAFGDVNPPVHAWAAWRVYKIDARISGKPDRRFLERVFHKLLLNFTWWVNRKDPDGLNVFQGGFLGLDNIGVFDRSRPLPGGGNLEQSDGTAWMGMYCLNMLAIALELARQNRVYEDVASKFFEHFLYIAAAMNNIGGNGIPLWNEQDQFFYDVMHMPDGSSQCIRVRSLVGLIPLLAVETIDPDLLQELPRFKGRMDWFLENRPELASLVSRWYEPGQGERRLLALARGSRMKRLLKRMLDPQEFLSDYGVRSVSRDHRDHPFVWQSDGRTFTVDYEPAESRTGLFGGNSNWRGPIWMPINYLLVEALQRFHYYYGDDFLVECPSGSGQTRTLWQIGEELSRRLQRLFLRDANGRRAVFGANEFVHADPLWCDYVPFYEYFHGDTGAGLGASHQTGWTALVAKLIDQTEGRGLSSGSASALAES
jgi:hypothetical protein